MKDLNAKLEEAQRALAGLMRNRPIAFRTLKERKQWEQTALDLHNRIQGLKRDIAETKQQPERST